MARTLTPYRTFVNDKGRAFGVRYLPVGAKYGRRNALTIDDGYPCVEFYDVTHADDALADGAAGFGALGQFTGGRYRVETLLGRDTWGSGQHHLAGLDLYGGVEVWKLDAATMRQVLAWLATLGNTWTDSQVGEFVTAFVASTAQFGVTDADRGKLPTGADPVQLLGTVAREQLGKRARMLYTEAASDLATWFDPGHAGWQLYQVGRTGSRTAWAGLPTDADDGVVFSEYATRVLRVPDKEAYAEYRYAVARLTVLARGMDIINRLVVDKRDDGLIHLADITH